MILPSQTSVLKRMTLRHGILLLAGFCLLLFAAVASGKPEFPGQFRTSTGIKASGEVDKANNSCKLCHSPSPPKLNPYGKDIEVALDAVKAKQLTEEIMKVAGAVDSDGDGVLNAAEVSEDTLPNDAKSRPAGTPTPATMTNANPAPVEEAPGLWHPKTLLAPDHAQHPIFVHFPIALFIMSLFFDVLGFRTKQPGLRVAGYWNLVAGALTSLAAIVTGILAWRIKFGGVALEGNLLYHLVTASVSTLLMFALWWIRLQYRRKPGAGLGWAYAVFSAALILLISAAGHLGGALVRGG